MNLRKYLFDNGIKISSFAKKCGISRPVIYRILAGNDIWLSTALKIQQGTNYSVSLEEMAPFASSHTNKNKCHDID